MTMYPVVPIGVGILLVGWLLICIIFNGYPAMVESLALILKRHARSVRAMHRKREEVLAQGWAKELGAVD